MTKHFRRSLPCATMHLYNVTLQPPSIVTAAVVGQFRGTRQQDIVVVRGSRLNLFQVDSTTGQMTRVLEQHTFGNVRSAACFRLTGGSKDYLILGSDSGRIVILEYDVKENAFVKVHQETFGRSGNRRIVPGQYLATDPKGRAVLIGAVEKSKLIYILNRDAAANLTISSPLEAHRPAAIAEAVVGVDVGYENPLFASLEIDYADADADPSGAALARTPKLLTYYELDLGLNHVVRRWTEPVDMSAHHLVQVPGGYNHNTERWDGPSGVLMCIDDYLVYKHQGQPEHRVPIPRRAEGPTRSSMIVASVLHRMKAAFFFLLQNEDGDLFKVVVEHDEEEITALRIKYFETVPVAVALSILRAGFLMVASEAGAPQLYSFQKLGDDDNVPEYVSTSYAANGTDVDAPPSVPTFEPVALGNLALADETAALDPLLDARVSNPLQTDAPQIYATCGRGERSTFRRLRHGLDVSEIVASDLPGVPNAVWSTKLRRTDEYDGYIVLSFVNGTLVLSIGETIEEVVDSGFLTTAPTLCVQQLGDDAVLQVHPRGIRHILATGQVNEWPAPTLPDGTPTAIVASASNERQVVVALDSYELVYFELDMDNQLNEYQARGDMRAPVMALGLGACPAGRQRSPYVAVGCADPSVRIVSLEPESTLAQVSMQALTAPPSSLCTSEMYDVAVDRHHLSMFVSIGLENGVYIRTVLDPASGQLTDTRTRFLGSRPVLLRRVDVHGESAIVAMSSRAWLGYTLRARVHFTPLIYPALADVSSFHTELCPHGLLGISGDSLRIFTFTQLGGELKHESLSLAYTPRKMVVHPEDPAVFYVVESDHRVRREGGMLVRSNAGHWASCVRVVDGAALQTVDRIDADADEAVLSLALVPFTSAGGELFLVVGSAVGVTLTPRQWRAAYLTTYRLAERGRRLELVHRTEVDAIPLALRAFQGRLLAGVGPYVRIYELGIKKLLRKCQSAPFPSTIIALDVQGLRVYVGDMQESVHYAMYKAASNSIVAFADDTMPRWTTCMLVLDYDTVMAADKFGNVYVLRIDSSASMAADEDPTGLMLQNERPYLMGAAHKAQMLAHYHIGDVVTSLALESLVPGGRKVVVYTGLGGTLGALIPFASKEHVELFTMLEMHMRQEAPSLVGRDHLAYRGHYVPVKAVVDGDLCELYARLPHERQSAIAEELDRTPSEINRVLAELRESTTGL